MKPGLVTESVDIERPIEEVFAFVADLTHDPQWFRGVRSVRVVSTVHSGVGTEYEQTTVLFGWPFTARVRVTEYEPPHRMALVSLHSATPFEAVYRLAPLDGGRTTRYTLDAEVAGVSFYRVFGPLFLPLLRRATRSRLHGLKLLLEKEAVEQGEGEEGDADEAVGREERTVDP